MNTWVRRSLSAGALTAGAVMAAGATAAHADTTMISSDNTGILNGTQVFAPIQAPINLCGVAAAVGGKALAGCEGGSAASLHGLYDVTMISHDNTGILNGTQLYAPIQAPVNICGVAVSVLGDALAGCNGGASATQGAKPGHHKSGHGGYDGHGGPLGGGPFIESGRTEGVQVSDERGGSDETKRETPRRWNGGRDVTMISNDNIGILNGTQVHTPIQVPIDVSGVAAAVLGQASAWSTGGSSARN